MKCNYHGKSEICLMKGNKYPVTENGKLSYRRIRAAETYGSKYNDLAELKRNGLCKYVKKVGIKKSKVCR